MSLSYVIFCTGKPYICMKNTQSIQCSGEAFWHLSLFKMTHISSHSWLVATYPQICLEKSFIWFCIFFKLLTLNYSPCFVLSCALYQSSTLGHSVLSFNVNVPCLLYDFPSFAHIRYRGMLCHVQCQNKMSPASFDRTLWRRTLSFLTACLLSGSEAAISH